MKALIIFFLTLTLCGFGQTMNDLKADSIFVTYYGLDKEARIVMYKNNTDLTSTVEVTEAVESKGVLTLKRANQPDLVFKNFYSSYSRYNPNKPENKGKYNPSTDFIFVSPEE